VMEKETHLHSAAACAEAAGCVVGLTLSAGEGTLGSLVNMAAVVACFIPPAAVQLDPSRKCCTFVTNLFP
jgi:hypothetical protein